MEDKPCNFHHTLLKAKDYLDHSARTTCQIIALIWVGDQAEYLEVVDCLDSFVKIHIIGLFNVLQQENLVKSLETLSLHHSGSLYLISPCSESLKVLQHAMNDVFETHYQEYKGFISVGHLTTGFQLYPNPYLSIWSSYGMIHDLPIVFPTLLPIVGFCQMRTLSSIPSVYQFFIYPSAKPEDQNPLLALLSESLKRLKKAAIVQLETDWYGIITSHMDYKLIKPGESEQGEIVERSVLVLSVLKKKLGLGWINSIDDYIEQKVDNSMVDLKSYASYDLTGSDGYIIPSVSMEQLELDFARITEFLKHLPGKRISLFNLCERMRRKASTFGMPGIMVGIVHILQKEIAKEDKDKSYIIKELLYYINNKIVPIEWHELSNIEPEQTTKKMNILSLLD